MDTGIAISAEATVGLSRRPVDMDPPSAAGALQVGPVRG